MKQKNNNLQRAMSISLSHHSIHSHEGNTRTAESSAAAGRQDRGRDGLTCMNLPRCRPTYLLHVVMIDEGTKTPPPW